MIVIRDPKTFYFNFHRLIDVAENLKHENKFIIKSNESLELIYLLQVEEYKETVQNNKL